MSAMINPACQRFRYATEAMKRYFSDPEYKDPDRSQMQGRLLKYSTCFTKDKVKVDGALLDYIHDRILMYHKSMAISDMVYRAEKSIFENEVWPRVYERAVWNESMTHFLLEHAIFSSFIARFLVNVWECPAKAVLPAHGIAETMLGEPEVIPVSDPMFPFCWDQSYRMIQYRTEVPQEKMKKAKRILFVGGGLLPELFTNSYPLGEINQEYVVYDKDARLPEYLEKILGGKLKKFRIDYHIGDFEDAINTPGNIEGFDMIIANGVEAYRLARLAKDMSLYRKLLWLGGNVFFDLQLKHPVLLFDVMSLEWPMGMETIDGADAARRIAYTALTQSGFADIKSTSDPCDKGGSPAGLITMATAV